MKFAAFIFSILLFINGILLSFQYHVFSTNSENQEKAFSYAQDIEVTYRGNAFLVKQTFTNLPEDKIKISWPEKSKGKACEISEDGGKNNKGCSRLTDQLNSFKAGENSTQTITYQIPLGKKGLQADKLYKDVFVSLKNGIATASNVQVVDEKSKGGHWFTGLPKIGEKSLQLVDYSYFAGAGQVYEVYWTKQRLKKAFDGKEFSIYTKKFTPTKFTSTLGSMKVLEGGHIDIIESTKKENGSRILFTDTLKKAKLQEKVVVSQIKEQYQFSTTNKNLPILVASFSLNQSLGSAKDKEMVRVLNEHFNTKQREYWKYGLDELKGEKIDSNKLDDLLSETLNDKTSFFKLNETSGSTVVPLLFEEERELYLNDKKLSDVKIILRNGEILYAANPMLNYLGYKTSIGKNGYYVEKSERKLRFPEQQYKFYVDNQMRVDYIGAGPIVEVGGTYYIEESWMIRVFRLNPPDSEMDRIVFHVAD